MIIRKLNIKNFGKVHDKTLEFSPGINVLYGENESGKTTIHTFIKSMLFGLTRMRGKAARNDTYNTYEPWENPGVYGGIIWFNSKDHDYRLSRNFQKDHVLAELLNEDTKELADIDEVGLEKIFGNISEAIYDNTVSVAQLKSVTGQDLVRELQNYMASYQGAGDSSIDLGRAMQMLKMSRKGYQVQADRKQKETETEQQKLQAKMDYVINEMNDLKEKLADIDEKEGSLGMRPGDENGAVLLDEEFKRIGTLSQFVHPEHGVIDYFIENLTGIKNVQVKHAPRLQEALLHMLNWIGDREYKVYAWSGSDRAQILHEIKAKNIVDEKIASFMEESRWVDYQDIFMKRYEMSRKMSLEEAMGRADIDPEGRFHDGLNDAVNTGLLIEKLELNPDYQLVSYEMPEKPSEHLSSSLGELFAGMELKLA